ncbi:hypothetical protein DFH29DRAFT_879613 [Suillus ampliporus]|nr:hypothetical protein DFH29DRAFT_879613 [Suillus ampliporus]
MSFLQPFLVLLLSAMLQPLNLYISDNMQLVLRAAACLEIIGVMRLRGLAHRTTKDVIWASDVRKTYRANDDLALGNLLYSSGDYGIRKHLHCRERSEFPFTLVALRQLRGPQSVADCRLQTPTNTVDE